MALSGIHLLAFCYFSCWLGIFSYSQAQESTGRTRGDQPQGYQQLKNQLDPLLLEDESDKNHLDPLLLEDESENQENVLSQLLSDYDKVKAISEGADCRCKCLVRPLGRDACRRINEGTANLEDVYTVETINSGPDCKCSCVAPPSAVNPCEGDYRLQQLREAERNGYKLSSVVDLLEGSLYGLDLLKLHSVTTKILNRVEKLEKQKEVHISVRDIIEGVNAENVTELKKETKVIPPTTTEQPQTQKLNTDKTPNSEAKTVPDLGAVLQGDAAAAAYGHNVAKYEEQLIGEKVPSVEAKTSTQLKQYSYYTLHQKPVIIIQDKKPLPRSAVIRGITYYNAREEDLGDIEEHQDEFASGETGIDLLVEDNLIRHQEHEVHSTKTPAPVPEPAVTSLHAQVSQTTAVSLEHVTTNPATPNTTQVGPSFSSAIPAESPIMPTSTPTEIVSTGTSTPISATHPETTPPGETTDAPATTTYSLTTPPATTVFPSANVAAPFVSTHSMTTARTSSTRASTARTSTARPSTVRTSTVRSTTTKIRTTKNSTAKTSKASTTTHPVPAAAPVTTPSTTVHMQTPTSLLQPLKSVSSTSSSTLSPTTTTETEKTPAPENAVEFTEFDINKSIGACKDTLSTISGPMVHNTYGRSEGAWMKDPKSKEDKIYVTNYYYGNSLVEFRNMESFQQGRWSNSYKLPYSWIGTGHVVYNGAFYYNRAFTRNIIKYDLKMRFVAAWAMLHDAIYEEATPWRWRGHSDIDFAVDENGLWVIYPAIDEVFSNQEIIVLSKLNAADLSMHKETTWRTGLRKNLYGNCFVICGVLYAVDSYDHRNANISYAFDTHTNTQLIPRLQFINEYSYTTQIDYNPRDRSLYTWDNGRQVTYQVIFAY
ncbi:olfactomedin-like protein 2B [Protopterus annectens]|uniref:olfactomedin-like protein 2B n=1 Tax=Protopterus annectens TaxID=7888 RepID=UPI001CFC069C|nr:olfactomedin-like protein 2B [Protopterus annectens]